EGAHQHGPHVLVEVLDAADPPPPRVQLRDGELYQVVGAVLVAAEQVAEAPQRHQPAGDVLDVLLLRRVPHSPPPMPTPESPTPESPTPESPTLESPTLESSGQDWNASTAPPGCLAPDGFRDLAEPATFGF